MTSARTYSVTRGPDGAWFLLADGWPVCSFLDEAEAREAAEHMRTSPGPWRYTPNGIQNDRAFQPTAGTAAPDSGPRVPTNFGRTVLPTALRTAAGVGWRPCPLAEALWLNHVPGRDAMRGDGLRIPGSLPGEDRRGVAGTGYAGGGLNVNLHIGNLPWWLAAGRLLILFYGLAGARRTFGPGMEEVAAWKRQFGPFDVVWFRVTDWTP